MGELNAKQTTFLNHLLQGKSIVDAARDSEVAERTARRWVVDPLFDQAYQRERKQMLDQSLTLLQLRFNKAVETVDRHMAAPKTIPRDQIKAAEVVIDKTIQTADLQRRIQELEKELERILTEQEQDRMYKVVFDLRKLTKEERETLERIDDAVTSRANNQ
jgi:hypothetical protein